MVILQPKCSVNGIPAILGIAIRSVVRFCVLWVCRIVVDRNNHLNNYERLSNQYKCPVKLCGDDLFALVKKVIDCRAKILHSEKPEVDLEGYSNRVNKRPIQLHNTHVNYGVCC